MFVFAINRTGPQPASATRASALRPQASGARDLLSHCSGVHDGEASVAARIRRLGWRRQRARSDQPFRARALRLVETDESTAVALTHDAHQGREPDAGVLRGVGPDGKADSMNTHAAVAGFILAIDDIHRLDDRVDRRAGELIAEHIQANLFVRAVIGTDGLDDALDGARVGERVPGAQPLDRRAALRRRVGNPLALVAAEHVDAFVVHHLETLHFRVQVQRLLHLLSIIGQT